MLSKAEKLTYQIIGMVRAFTESEGGVSDSCHKELLTQKLIELDEAREEECE